MHSWSASSSKNCSTFLDFGDKDKIMRPKADSICKATSVVIILSTVTSIVSSLFDFRKMRGSIREDEEGQVAEDA